MAASHLASELTMAILNKKRLDHASCISFDSDVDNYFLPGNEKIGDIMREKITEEQKNLLNKATSMILSWIRDEYIPFRSECEDQKAVYNFLLKGIFEYVEPVIEALRTVLYKYSLVSLFVIVGSLYILLLQELVAEDPEASRPEDSYFWSKLIEQGDKQAEYIENCYNDIKSTRIVMMSEVSLTSGCDDSYLTISWRDNFIGFLDKTNFSEKDKLEEFLESTHTYHYTYISQIDAELQRSLHNPLLVALAWRKCAHRFIPASR